MASCASADACPFYAEVEASIVKRIRFASAYPYCNGNWADRCAIQQQLAQGLTPDGDLLPDGSRGIYRDGASDGAEVLGGARGSRNRRFLVIEDSPIFAGFATNTIKYQYPDAEVVECHSFATAEPELRSGAVTLVVSGFGLDGGKTAHDVRKLCDAPMVVLTGRPDRDTAGLGNVATVQKGAGADAMRAAIGGLLGA